VEEGMWNWKTDIYMDPKLTLTKKHFVLKVQADNEVNTPITIYNEDRSVMGPLFREGAEETYDKLKQQVRQHGVQGKKAFFYAICKGEKEGNVVNIEINPEVVQPVETW
jgi:hypothetical protein